MTDSVRELQVTPVPDTVDAPGLGFLPLAAGFSLPRLQIAAYRYLGSRWANLDPLQRQERDRKSVV